MGPDGLAGSPTVDHSGPTAEGTADEAWEIGPKGL